MKFLTLDQGRQWFLSKINCSLDDFINYEPGPFEYGASFNLPDSSSDHRMLSRAIINIFEFADENAYYIYDCESWSWPGRENLELFDVYRKSIGENEPVVKRSFHVFSQAELLSIDALLTMTLYFGWQAILIDRNSKTLLHVGDGLFFLYANGKDYFSRIRSEFQFYDETKPSIERNKFLT